MSFLLGFLLILLAMGVVAAYALRGAFRWFLTPKRPIPLVMYHATRPAGETAGNVILALAIFGVALLLISFR